MRRSDLRALCHRFLSTPSARRATLQDCAQIYWLCISIHALREEGDSAATLRQLSKSNFYPRPPRGGRRPANITTAGANRFLSTPSARRATGTLQSVLTDLKFLSTPSARRATSR